MFSAYLLKKILQGYLKIKKLIVLFNVSFWKRLLCVNGQLREGFKKKKVWNFPYFSGVGGFEKVIFHKK